MTHEEILLNCIEAANKRRLAYLKASNPYKGTAEKLFKVKLKKTVYPDLEDIANTKSELISKYGDKSTYIPDLKNLFS